MAGQLLFAVLVWGSILAVIGAFGYVAWTLRTA
ncbi:MAG: hypothetical protein J07HN6_01619 [Halonotius sp. J07HN6]|nr:MAG: hypothetical protein J07HN6_01619 [Halonotius sp. J07HN6]ERH05493.1 MAG: hypothetical protein J07HN4v3_01094 [Halonotius sp. J07HN4]